MAKRPVGVTIVAVLGIVLGITQIIGGIVAFGANTAGTGGLIIAAGVIGVVLGVLTVLVSLALLRGSGLARVLVTIVFILDIVSGIYVMVSAHSIASGIVSVVLAIVGIVLLWTRAASDFFRTAR